MKHRDYTYVPIYKDYDLRSPSEKIFDVGSEMLLWLLLAGACWFGCSILLLWIPSTAWLFYWPLVIIKFIGKWATIIGWPIWIIIEIIGVVRRSKEKSAERKAFREYFNHANEEQ